MTTPNTDRVESWAKSSEPVAAQIVECRERLSEVTKALRCYFLRKAIAMNAGTISRASLAVNAHRNTVCRWMRFRSAQMNPLARRLAENWATWLAEQGASLEEAERVFTGALVAAARAACKDNQCKAAQVLGIHRNSVRRLSTAAALHKEVA